MHNNTNGLDNQYLLNTPLAYVLQDYTLTDIESVVDENGWNVLHWAVANADIPKIKELIHFSFKLNKNSKNNVLPQKIFYHKDKRKDYPTTKPVKIPFCNRGFTPTHLAIYLFHHYEAITDSFNYEFIVKKYQQILDLLITQDGMMEFELQHEFSLFDYAFLLENIKTITLLHMHDPEFTTLHRIRLTTAKNIIQTMEVKFGNTGLENVLDQLNIIISKQKLEQELPTKLNPQKNTVKKI